MIGRKVHLTWWEEQDSSKPILKPLVEGEIDQEDWKNHTINLIEELDDEEIGNTVLISYIEEMKMKVWINVKENMVMELVIKENEKKAKLTNKELVLDDLHEFLDVFNKNKANWFPESNVWDHKIDMKEGFEPKYFKKYNLTPEELDKFLNENLEKEYIQPSQSLMASSFFFVKKKDGKLWLCQDYWYLNDWTIKNAYLLPLISKIMDKLKEAKYFLKFDVWWGYNSVWIWSGDEWKAMFKTNWGLYKPTVMFFGMCISLATFLGHDGQNIQERDQRQFNHCLYISTWLTLRNQLQIYWSNPQQAPDLKMPLAVVLSKGFESKVLW